MDGWRKVKVCRRNSSIRETHSLSVYSFDLWKDDPFAMGQHLRLLHNAFRRRSIGGNETRSEVSFSRLGVVSFIALHKNITIFKHATSYVWHKIQIINSIGERRGKMNTDMRVALIWPLTLNLKFPLPSHRS